MAGIPAQHAGMASGFLMTGHEIGTALGVAVLSAVAATAGSLTEADGVAAGFSRGFVVAAAIAALVAVVAFVPMPSTRLTGSTQIAHALTGDGSRRSAGRRFPRPPRPDNPLSLPRRLAVQVRPPSPSAFSPLIRRSHVHHPLGR
jgi:hypothetical protein